MKYTQTLLALKAKLAPLPNTAEKQLTGTRSRFKTVETESSFHDDLDNFIAQAKISQERLSLEHRFYWQCCIVVNGAHGRRELAQDRFGAPAGPELTRLSCLPPPSSRMARAAASPTRVPVADLDIDAQHEELKEIRDREDMWRQLKVLFCVEDNKYPVVLAMLERWILLDDPALPLRKQKRADALWDSACDALDMLNETVDDENRVAAAVHRRCVLSVTDCAQSWANLARAVHNFEDDELDWIASKADEAVNRYTARRPDFSTSLARLAERKATLLEAVGEEDEEREDTPPGPTIEESVDSEASSPQAATRAASHASSGRSSSKRARENDARSSGEEELLQEEDEDVPPARNKSCSMNKKRRNVVVSCDAPAGVADGDLATKKASLDDLKSSTDAKLDEQAILIRAQTQEIRELRDLMISLVPSIDLNAHARAGLPDACEPARMGAIRRVGGGASGIKRRMWRWRKPGTFPLALILARVAILQTQFEERVDYSDWYTNTTDSSRCTGQMSPVGSKTWSFTLQIQMQEVMDAQEETAALVEYLTVELEDTQLALERANSELEAAALYTSALHVELDQQYEHISRLSAGRRGNGDDADDEDESDSDDDDEGGVLSHRSLPFRQASKNSNVKFVLNEAIRKTMNVLSLKTAYLPKFVADPVASDSDSDVWDEPFEDERNVKAVERVTQYVLDHGNALSPQARSPLKILQRDGVQLLVAARFTHLANKFLQFHVLQDYQARLDGRLVAGMNGQPPDPMLIDEDADAKALQLRNRLDKAKSSAIQADVEAVLQEDGAQGLQG
ncbi:hypothetical protein EXIGLDRAFT_695891 [Exidia glandulosa HHB12029]|uniref:Uncharacterized protein n=1 Tax=Exidia glandulosa HHB12029 TaxID=1314781 RepID=A0A166BRP5_EXIGL|nr:hypothetical protein EXIGLDRAFT_695891 [Exidia glandulosa HHB12029]